MLNIKVSELRPTGSELFQHSESLFHDLSDDDSILIHGGQSYEFLQFLNFGVTALEYAVVGFAIYSIASLATSFTASRQPLL